MSSDKPPLTHLARQQKLNAAKHLSWMIDNAKEELKANPSDTKALEIQRLQRQRKAIQAEIQPLLITGKWNEDPPTEPADPGDGY